jgi:hypothetical protein
LAPPASPRASNAGARSDTVSLSLLKRRDSWWPSLVQGQPEIDTSLVDSSRSLDDYDAETQAAIRKIMADRKA